MGTWENQEWPSPKIVQQQSHKLLATSIPGLLDGKQYRILWRDKPECLTFLVFLVCLWAHTFLWCLGILTLRKRRRVDPWSSLTSQPRLYCQVWARSVKKYNLHLKADQNVWEDVSSINCFLKSIDTFWEMIHKVVLWSLHVSTNMYPGTCARMNMHHPHIPRTYKSLEASWLSILLYLCKILDSVRSRCNIGRKGELMWG